MNFLCAQRLPVDKDPGARPHWYLSCIVARPYFKQCDYVSVTCASLDNNEVFGKHLRAKTKTGNR